MVSGGLRTLFSAGLRVRASRVFALRSVTLPLIRLPAVFMTLGTSLCLAPSAGLAADARITLSTTSDTVYLNDSIIIDVTASGLLDDIDTRSLADGTRLIRQTEGTRISVVEGQVVDIVSHRIEFEAHRTGTLVFGPLSGESSAGPVSSNSVTVEVLPAADTDWTPAADDATLELSVSNRTPWVGEELVLDLVLRHRYPLSDEQIQLPALEGFDRLAVFEARRTNDGDWRQTAWRWLLHPQRSGRIVVEPVRWRASLLRSRTQRARFTRSSKPLVLGVKPAATDDWWLPARDVRLSDSWSGNVLDLAAGDEIVRHIKLEADGVLARQLPTIEPLPSQGFTRQLIGSERSSERRGNTTVASATFSFRMTAKSPIPVFLDTVRVPWWRVGDDTAQESIIPARRIDIAVPERGDLLSDIASRQGLIERLHLWSMSAVRWQGALVLLTLLALMAFSARSIVATLRWLRERWRRHRRIRNIEQLQRSGDVRNCYLQLRAHLAGETPGRNDRQSLQHQHHQALLVQLGRQLFSDSTRTSG